MQFWSLFREFAVALQTAIEEVQVGGDILVVGTTATEGAGSDGIEDDVVGLGVGTELMALQIAPLGTHGA